MRGLFWPATGPMHRGLMMSDLLGLMNYSPSTSSVGDSPVKTSPLQERVKVSQGADLAYFGSYTASFARWCPESSSWRTCQLSVNGEAQRYVGRWPTSGMICGGVAYPQPKWARLTSESGGSALGGESARPTPRSCTAMQAEITPKRALDKFPNLEVIIARQAWPTPLKNDGKNASLPPSMAEWDNIPGSLIREGEKGYLNPSWVEALMGFPPGWTNTDGPPLPAHSTHGKPLEPEPDSPTTATG